MTYICKYVDTSDNFVLEIRSFVAKVNYLANNLLNFITKLVLENLNYLNKNQC